MGFELFELPIYSISEIGLIPPYTYKNLTPKYHTIRSGNRWKAGDKFSPRVWGNNINPMSGRSGPYHSEQIIIAPDIKIEKVWKFEIIDGKFYLNDRVYSGEIECDMLLKHISRNDGLSKTDFVDWFTKSPEYKKAGKYFKGQIICWNENVIYS